MSVGAQPLQERVTIPGPAGDLEARIETPQNVTEVKAFGVICHPHPLFGGTLENKVVYTVSRALHDLGMPTIRFNFRGVGKSTGAFAEGIGETDDAMAVVAAGRQKWPDAQLWLAGFSFGGAVAIRAAALANPARLVTVAPAIRRVAIDDVPPPVCPWLIVHGDRDDVVDPNDVVTWANGLTHRPSITLVPGVEHFFHGKLNELRDAVVRFGRG